MKQSAYTGRPVYVIDGARTPFLKFRGVPGPFTSSDLAVEAGKTLLLRQPFGAEAFDEVILGNVMANPDQLNVARLAALRLGMPKTMPAYSVARNCASGMQALDNAATNIAMGRSDLVLAGGTEAMSHAPLLYSLPFATWLGQWNQQKSVAGKLQQMARFRHYYLAPVIALLKGLSDPITGLSMGQTAEKLSYQFGITREEMDNFAVKSHLHLHQAQMNQWLPEITPLFDAKGKVYETDDGVRPDSTLEKLAKLPAYFDKKYGAVTAGNSSQITDGASLMILASEDAVKKYNLTPMARIVDCEWAGVDPSVMGLGPVHAVAHLLKRCKMQMDDVDFWEINEAFAAQVIAVTRAWNDKDYCQSHFDMDAPLGKLDHAKLNVDGGAIALGHPVGASGARIVNHLINVLKRNNAKRGIASLCIGGGQGGAMLIEV